MEGDIGKSSERPMTIDLEEEEEEPWDTVSLRGSQIIDEQVSQRLNQLEHVLWQVVGQMQQLCPAAPEDPSA